MHQNKANGSGQSNTEAKQRSLANLRPFKKGDPRINRNGRPKSFDQCRSLAQSLAHEAEASQKEGEPEITAIERVLKEWRDSGEPSLQMRFVEIAFGKVPDKLEMQVDDKRTLHLHWPHERPDLATANDNGNQRN